MPTSLPSQKAPRYRKYHSVTHTEHVCCAARLKPRSNRHESSLLVNKTTLHQHLKPPNSHLFDAEFQAVSRDTTRKPPAHAPLLVPSDTSSSREHVLPSHLRRGVPDSRQVELPRPRPLRRRPVRRLRPPNLPRRRWPVAQP